MYQRNKPEFNKLSYSGLDFDIVSNDASNGQIAGLGSRISTDLSAA